MGSFGDLASIVGLFLGRFSYNSIGDFTFLIRTGVILVIFVMSFQLLRKRKTLSFLYHIILQISHKELSTEQ